MNKITAWLMYIPQILDLIFETVQEVELHPEWDGPTKESKVVAKAEGFIGGLTLTDAQKATTANIITYIKLAITAQVMINNISHMWGHHDTPPVVVPPVVTPPANRRTELTTELARLHGKLDEWNVKAESPERTQRLQNLNLKIDAAQAELLKLK